MKYGIMYYKETDNIGDDIQTYTAKRFLPHIDYCIDRENLNCFLPKKKEYVSMIMNGWFMHNKAAWPPSPYIHPLLLSMHFTSLEKIDVGEKYLQGLGGDYLRKHQPIGARDTETQKRLSRNKIENYFSGCMTLTIEPFEAIEKQDYICLVDLDEKSSNLVKKATTREIKEITHDVNPEEIKKKTFEKRMEEVEALLKTYQAAHIVLTNRLHVALPCIALGTPVVLIHKEHFEEDRLGTFLQYVTSFSDSEFEKINSKELIENPKSNSKKYLEIREPLIKKCQEFIEECEKENIKDADLPEIESYQKYVESIKWYQQLHEEIRVKAKKNIYESETRYQQYEETIKGTNEKWKNKYENLEKEKEKWQEESKKTQEKYQKEKEKLRKLKSKIKPNN